MVILPKISKKKLVKATLVSGALLSTLVYTIPAFIHPTQVAAQSAERRTFTITPPSIEITGVNPGTEKSGILKISNDSDESLTFNLSLQDYIVEDNNGTPKFLTDGELSDQFSAASWIGVSPTRVTVAPRTREEISYFLKIPANARPGGHYAAVTYTPTNGDNVKGTGAAVTTVVGTLFYITINGPIKEQAVVTKISAPSISEYSPVHIHSTIKNNGDEHIKPYGTITIKNIFGKIVSTQVLQPNNIFPLASREYENILSKGWLFGRYTAVLDAKYGRNNALVLTGMVAFWVIPWKLLILIALVIAAGVLAYLYMKKKNNPPTNHPEGETLIEKVEDVIPGNQTS
jgi:hypothetical protein